MEGMTKMEQDELTLLAPSCNRSITSQLIHLPIQPTRLAPTQVPLPKEPSPPQDLPILLIRDPYRASHSIERSDTTRVFNGRDGKVGR